ncbi:MAG: MBL fold metallo-hydrolase [Dehalococcoidia bacterium]|nr:MAG: MBL fold metallo-hydrolase [Dehalococcoidia bacterium]
MGLRITTLSENTAGMDGFLGEWGLSILVESDEAKILFDTGQNVSTIHNAKLLGIDLSQIDKIVLSHGHFDHTGGLRQTLSEIGREIEVIAHPDIWQAKYAARQGEEARYIGIPFSRGELEDLGAKFKLTSEPVAISDSIMTSGEIPLVTDFENIEPFLVVKEDGNFEPDIFRDDQALIIKTPAGLVVILGCAHRGIINTLYHAQKLSGAKKIDSVIGGCHLMNSSEERIWRTIAALKELGVGRLGVCHCTGMAASVIMVQEFGDRFLLNNAGTVLNL